MILKTKETINFDVLDFEDACAQSIVRNGPSDYTCLCCGKVSVNYANAKHHYEAKHAEFQGFYQCELCQYQCKTKHALQCHKSRKHRM